MLWEQEALLGEEELVLLWEHEEALLWEYEEALLWEQEEALLSEEGEALLWEEEGALLWEQEEALLWEARRHERDGTSDRVQPQAVKRRLWQRGQVRRAAARQRGGAAAGCEDARGTAEDEGGSSGITRAVACGGRQRGG